MSTLNEEQKEKIKAAKRAWNKANRHKMKESSTKFYAANPDYSKRKSKEWHKANPRENKRLWLKRQYGMTLEQYDELSKKQNECCAICKKHRSLFSKDLFVDHNHTTGVIRGLLCDKCNRAVGLLDDNADSAQNAALYLRTT